MYTRGTPIPLLLTVACSDKQALELMFSPSSTSVHLFREVSYGVDNSPPTSLSSASASPAKTSAPSSSSNAPSVGNSLSSTTNGSSNRNHTNSRDHKQAPKLALRRARTCIASAVWWNPRRITAVHQAEDGRLRMRMEGDIIVPRDSPPSFTFGPFKTKVCVPLSSSLLINSFMLPLVLDCHASFLRIRLRAYKSRREGPRFRCEYRNSNTTGTWTHSTLVCTPWT